jgi:uncharacterized protein (TIGR03437 family)
MGTLIWLCVTALGLLQTVSGQTTSATVTVVSAASYAPGIAPDSLAAVFGQALAGRVVVAELDARGHLPVTLDGTQVTINGRPAPLVFVSPLQINCLVPSATEIGEATVIVTSSSTATAQGKLRVQQTAPGIFTLDGSGKGVGAMLNAQTFLQGPFRVETFDNPGSDKRTRLAIYATGLRYAGSALKQAQRRAGEPLAVRSHLRDTARRLGAAAVMTLEPDAGPRPADATGHVTVQASSPAIGSRPLLVESAGPAPGFFGLDQVNVVLGRELDGAGSVELQLTANGRVSNRVTAVLERLPSIDNCGVTPQPCADLRGKWAGRESMVEVCTYSAMGESDTDAEQYSASGQVEIGSDGPCSFGYQPFVSGVSPGLISEIDKQALRRSVQVSGNRLQVTGQAVVLLPNAPVPLTENKFEGRGTVCGNRLVIDGVSTFAVNTTFEGIQVNVLCTLTSQAELYRSF